MPGALRNGRARAAVVTVAAPIHAAIYTRVSTDERLGQSFNSLHNQRERAENYVAAQRGEGWELVPDRYDDPGFSGGTLDRPALQRLIADVDAGRIQRIVVYKIDRLSRSLADFVKLAEFFEQRGASIVSVTQQFDTSTSMGRLTLNMLLSFAQFEREMVSDRTKDKLGAARRKGKYVGGYPVLGYDRDPAGGRLVVNKAEAEIVCEIFRLFLEKRSLVVVADQLNRRGWALKRWTTKGGKSFGGGRFDKSSLRRLLTNHTYIGKVNFQGTVYDGEHDAIVSPKLFREVQRILEGNRRDGGATHRNRHGALLRGLLRCGTCDAPMSFAPVKKDNRVYRYYRCSKAMKRGEATCPTGSVPADRVEAFVVDEIRRIGADPELQRATFNAALAQLKAQGRGLKAERKRLDRDLATARGDIERLVGAISRVTGPAADAVAGELARAQEHLATLEARQREVQDDLAALAAQDVDREELARALEAFDPVWDVLLTPEKERVMRLLIERVSYDGATGRLEIGWRLAGFGDFAREVEGA